MSQTFKTTYPVERVDIARKAAAGFLQYADDMEAGDAEALQKLVELLDQRLRLLIPTTRMSVGAAHDAATICLAATAKAREQFPFLTARLRQLDYLLKEAFRAVAKDGILLKEADFRLYCDIVDGVPSGTIVNLNTGEVITHATPLYKTMGGNHNSTSARNTPRLCKLGDLLLLEPGLFPETRFTWEEKGLPVPCDPTVPWTIIHARRQGEVVFRPKPGSKALYDEWRNWPVVVRNLVMEGGDPGAWMTENPSADRWYGNHPGFAPIRFENLKVDGSWNAEIAGDPPDKNKWGALGYHHGVGRTKDEPGIECDGLDISGIWEEHAWYWHNLWAPQWDWIAARFRNFRIKHCGRTAFQHVARINEGPAGQGRVIVEDGTIEDVCLQSGGGGSAITIAGRHYGAFEISRVHARLGCNPRLASTRSANITGALVVYCGDGSENIPTSDVVLDGCDFEFGQYFPGQGSARRALVKVGQDFSQDDPEKVGRKVVERFTMQRTRLKGWPGTREVFNVSAPTSFGTLRLAKPVAIDPVNGNDVGACMFAGQKYATYAEMLNAIDGLQGVVVL